MNRRAFLQTAGFGTGIAFTAARRAFAQSYPSRAVRVVVPASASTPPDILARIIANNLSEREGWKMIVENKPGAVMTIGISDVLKQEPDGYNLLSTTAPIAAVPGLMPNASFNIETDFKPIIQVGTGYNVLVVNPKLSVHTVSELITYLKQDQASILFHQAASGRPRICSASCSSSKPGFRLRMFPTPSFHRRSRIF